MLWTDLRYGNNISCCTLNPMRVTHWDRASNDTIGSPVVWEASPFYSNAPCGPLLFSSIGSFSWEFTDTVCCPTWFTTNGSVAPLNSLCHGGRCHSPVAGMSVFHCIFQKEGFLCLHASRQIKRGGSSNNSQLCKRDVKVGSYERACECLNISRSQPCLVYTNWHEQVRKFRKSNAETGKNETWL